MLRFSMVVAVALIAGLFTAASTRAQDSGAFVVRIGDDTLSVERFTYTPRQIRGEYVFRSPRSSRRSYTADLNPDGTVRKFEMLTRNLSGGPGPAETRSTIDFVGDSAFTTAPRGDSSFSTRLAVGKGGAPSLFGVMGLIELLGRKARALRSASYTVATASPGATSTIQYTLSPAGGDTMVLVAETSVGRLPPFRTRFDRAGRLLWFSGEGSVFQAETRRVDSVDLDAAEAAFAQRPLGALSARDTARARIGDAELWVDYGRPSKRGREIFGTVVSWNTVWRTGANAATQFNTPVELAVGSLAVPAGKYTLWTLPTPGGWKLILNKQTGQWGTVYDPSQDLGRVDMKVETAQEPVERMTIAIEPEGAGATLSISWDRTRAWVAIETKK